MNYPTLDEVEKANHEQICRWHRFLPSPGQNFIEKPEFEAKLQEECLIQTRIGEKLKAFGGFTPAISKLIGWK